MSFQYSENLTAVAFARQRKKLEVIGLDSRPYKYPADSWINNPSEWPEVEYPDIYTYLVNCPDMKFDGSVIAAHCDCMAG